MPYVGVKPAGISSASQVETDKLSVDNVQIDGNTISSTDTNGDINLLPNGSGGVDISGSSGATLKLTSTDTTGADTELLGQIDFVSSDSSTGSAGTQARIKGVYEDNGDSSGIAFITGASTGSGTPTISEVMRIRHEGKVGIGTTSPSVPFEVTTENGGFQAYLNNDNGSAQGLKIRIKANDSGDFAVFEGISASSGSDTTVFKIIDNGKVQIGTTATYGTQNINSNGSAIVYAQTNGHYRWNYQSSNQNMYWSNGSNQAYLSSSGAWTDASDVAYKKDITDATYGIDTVKALQPRFYYMKDDAIVDDSRQLGFIAQELEVHVPEVVTGSDGSKGVEYGHLTAVLAKALQEAVVKIETLETEMTALKARVTALEDA